MNTRRQQSGAIKNSRLDEDQNRLKQGFDAYNKERLNVEELLDSMKKGGLSVKNLVIFDMLTELGKKNSEIDFETYLAACDRVIGDRKTNDGLERMFRFFKHNKGGQALSTDELKNIAEELKIDVESDEYKDLFSEVTYDEFKEMMYSK
jgi:Ca2+-binding EF-hand superfamily protein